MTLFASKFGKTISAHRGAAGLRGADRGPQPVRPGAGHRGLPPHLQRLWAGPAGEWPSNLAGSAPPRKPIFFQSKICCSVSFPRVPVKQQHKDSQNQRTPNISNPKINEPLEAIFGHPNANKWLLAFGRGVRRMRRKNPLSVINENVVCHRLNQKHNKIF